MKNTTRTKDKKSKDERGYIHVYTGNGKGKTSAALGLAFRAMGNGMRSYIVQFMKGQHYSELQAADMVSSYITIEQFGRDTFLHISEVHS
ncbi:MAG: cob(I)yrinic acid a,c-diamide adenosyltransferase, partial [Proteobacteria bacterium]|nr:cob(I)yrinic acid a,c-diamide adenosyltransferase [Pseudomonadota bacterium]